MAKMHVKTGANVVLISGKDKGNKGKVVPVRPKEGKVIVKGLNIVTKHLKPRQMGQQGGIVNAEAPLYACKVMPVCPKCGNGVRTRHVIKEDGTKVRG